MNNNNITINIQ